MMCKYEYQSYSARVIYERGQRKCSICIYNSRVKRFLGSTYIDTGEVLMMMTLIIIARAIERTLE
jgi:hypothetical protein